ncbi:ferredoxin [Nocardia sp. NPDC051052]|uniref:ferredoxin n=1 Tax=Nocardia sp. NPDC051052 TaxID=3364322 RepID=UPI003790E4F2
MAYVITEVCVGNKDASCAEVCPVGCIHPEPGEAGFEAAEQLFIDPTAYIDCDACFSVCPVAAIHPADRIPAEHATSVTLNAACYG